MTAAVKAAPMASVLLMVFLVVSPMEEGLMFFRSKADYSWVSDNTIHRIICNVKSNFKLFCFFFEKKIFELKKRFRQRKESPVPLSSG